MPDNISTQIAEALQRHNIDLLRIDAATRRQAISVLSALGKKLVTKIGRFDPTGSMSQSVRARRQGLLITSTADDIGLAYKEMERLVDAEMFQVAKLEKGVTAATINGAVGVELVSGRISERLLTSAVSNALIEGAPSRDWWRAQSTEFAEAFKREMRQGILVAEPIPELVRRVRGRRENRFQDGIVAMKTRNAEALVRSSVMSVANQAREDLYQDNDDVLKGMQWLSTLDSRTTDICKALDGQAWKLNGDRLPGTTLKYRGPPPAHWSCRSTIVPVLKSWSELVKDPKIAAKLRRSEAAAPRGLRASLDGAVSADLNYEQWLRSKSEAFQREILGPTKLRLWKEGKLPFTQLVDQSHAPRTVAEIVRRAG